MTTLKCLERAQAISKDLDSLEWRIWNSPHAPVSNAKEELGIIRYDLGRLRAAVIKETANVTECHLAVEITEQLYRRLLIAEFLVHRDSNNANVNISK